MTTTAELSSSIAEASNDKLETKKSNCDTTANDVGNGLAVTVDTTTDNSFNDAGATTTRHTNDQVTVSNGANGDQEFGRNKHREGKTASNGQAVKSLRGDTSASTITNQRQSTSINRTDEEEKLRKRLHAKREEERLREILKRKKDSFRKSESIEVQDESKSTGNPVDDKKGEKGDGIMRKVVAEETNKTRMTETNADDEKVATNGARTHRENHHRRDRHRSDNELHERRGSHPPSEVGHQHHHRHERRLPASAPHSHTTRENRRDDARVRPVSKPSGQSPYNHSYYDNHRPPPHQPPYPPPHHDRGRERGGPPRGDDRDPFGRQRRNYGSDNSGNKVTSTNNQEYHHRRSRSPTRGSVDRQRKRHRSRSRSVSSSRSSRRASSYSRSSDNDSSRNGYVSRRSKSRRSSSSSRSSSRSVSSSSSRSRSHSSSSSVSVEDSKENKEESDTEEDPIPYSKDQRTVFVTQLVMRTTVRDLSKFFKDHGIKVNEIELLRDRRTGQHKGSAYVELKRMIDVTKSLTLSGQPPTFQRFPILIKESEAERNLPPSTVTIAPIPTIVAPNQPIGVNPVLIATMQQQLQRQATKIRLPPLKDANGQLIQSQKVYVGNLEVNVVTSQHLQLLFSPFGTLTEVQLQNGKGFAFLQYYDPKEAALAIQTMAGQVLAGRPMKTGWATNPVVSMNGVAVVTSNEFPPDAAVRVQNAYQILAQLTSATVVTPISTTVPYIAGNAVAATSTLTASAVPTVADARASLMATVNKINNTSLHYSTAATTFVPGSSNSGCSAAVDPMKIGNIDNPSRHVLVHNMFNIDEETEIGWENDIREEFLEECGKYGTIVNVTVVSREVGGKIFASFSEVAGAQLCAQSLAGRWFDRKQLRVEYATDEQVKVVEKEYPSVSPATTSAN
jgi:RNA-binding protein 23/39